MPSRALFGKQLLSLGGLSLLTGCASPTTIGRDLSHARLAPERPRAGVALRSEPARADLHRSADHAAVSVQRVLRHRRRAAKSMAASFRLKVSGLVSGQARVDAARAVRAAARGADHAAHLRGRLERDRPLGRHAVRGLPEARRRGYDGEIRRLQMRRRLLRKHRHADRAASADAAHASRTTAQTLPAKYGFPMKLRMPTKLGYKNPKHIMEIFVTNTYPWRLLGRPGIQLVRRLLTRRNLFPRSPRRNFDSPRLVRTALKTL